MLNVTIVGSGGLGSKFGALLAPHAAVQLFHRDERVASEISARGLTLVRGDERTVVDVVATSRPADLARTDVALVTVKSEQTRTAVEAVAAHLPSDAVFVTLQNGLGNVETIAGIVGEERTVLGVTMQGATMLGPGVVADMGRGPTYMSVGPSTRTVIGRLSDALNAAGLPTEVQSDTRGLLWGKLAMVAGINAVASVLRVPNGALGRSAAARELSLTAIRETVEVATALGVTLPFDPVAQFDSVTAATASMLSGTLIDVARGRKTEVDALACAIAAQGRVAGVPTPVNDALCRIVHALEETHADRLGAEERLRRLQEDR